MRLDRWLHRRFPEVANSHLMRIVRKGEVRVSGSGRTYQPGSRPAKTCACRRSDRRRAGACRRAANPGDREAIRAMILFEDRDVLVLNKPYGLAVQGGSGTTRHVDGMLQALADKEGNRPVLVHRLDRDTSGVLMIAKSRKIAAELGEIFVRARREDLLGAGRGRAEAGAGTHLDVSRQGRGDGTRGAKGRAGGSRADAGREARRTGRTAFVDPLCSRRQGRAAPRVAVDAAGHRPHASAARPLRGDRPSDRRRSEIQSKARQRSGARRSAARRSARVEPRLHLLARRLILPHPRGGIIDVTAPLPEHMRKASTCSALTAERDPIEDAPDE